MKLYHIPGVSIAVIKNYQLIWAKGFGVADDETQKPVTEKTLFQAGSISKPVTAIAVLKSVQTGKILLDAPVNQYLTSWKIPNNQFITTQQVTIRRLLDHSAAISVHGFKGYEKNEKLPTLIEVLNGSKPANSDPIRVISVPGEKFNYSGGGYTIIQQILIDIYHQTFSSVMDSLVLYPLNMSNSTFQQPLPNFKFKDIAMPYRQNGKMVRGGPHTYIELAAAGLWTTPSDLAKLVISLQKSLKGDNNQILNPQEAKLMMTPSINKHMGLGFEVGMNYLGKPIDNGDFFMHMGENEGYRNMLIGSIKNGGGVVIMTNMSEDTRLIPRQKAIESWTFFDKVIHKITAIESTK